MRVLITPGYYRSGHDVATEAMREEGEVRGHLVHVRRLWPPKSTVAARVLFRMYRDFARRGDARLPTFLDHPDLMNAIAHDLADYGLVNDFDVAIATHPYSGYILGTAAMQRDSRCIVAEAHTDFTPFPVCAHPRVDLYFGAIPALGVPRHLERRQVVTGIPVRRSFAPTDIREEREQRIVVFGGADGWFGLEPALDFLEELLRNAHGWACTVFVGRRGDLVTRLSNRFREFEFRAGITDCSYAMKLAQFVVTKPSGLTVAESLACGAMPVLLPSAVPWEAEAARQVGARGLAWQLGSYENDARERLHRLLVDRDLQRWVFYGMADFDQYHAAASIWDVIETFSNGVPVGHGSHENLEKYIRALSEAPPTDLSCTAAWLETALQDWYRIEPDLDTQQ